MKPNAEEQEPKLHENILDLLCLLPEAFGNEQGSKNRLLNILMNLRKCVDHPYLFDGDYENQSRWKATSCQDVGLMWRLCFPGSGVEPEPFEMGEHLVEASGKLCLLDNLLTYLHQGLVRLFVIGRHLVVSVVHCNCCCDNFLLCVYDEEATGYCCSPRWPGCWTYFRITWSTEVNSTALFLSLKTSNGA